MSTVVREPGTPYVFSNDRPTARQLLDALGQMHDPFTIRRLTEAGVKPGSRWLEIGAGAGTIAGWLADQVGPDGEVIATDVRPQHIREHSGVTVIQHNIVTDPLPAGQFDGIHARAVLQHLPERHEVLARLAGALKPGGVVVIEEMEAGWSRSVLSTPDERLHEITAHYEAALQQVLRTAGNDPTWCRSVFTAMEKLGLDEVDTQSWQGAWRGGTGAALLASAGSTEQRERLIAAGMTAEELDLLAALGMDPRVVLRGILVLSTVGRKAAA
ncbi:methyltransferase domain-containing protein [Actinoplanes sp. NPDC026619]|uniref:methyltransferase domain-containing protein n=1 Tax=Actinoplanes sp. NPDC026619 TaxID=3155798 RepID=UPI0033C9FC2A